MSQKILVVDDEPDMLSTCKAALAKDGWEVATEDRPAVALEKLRVKSFDLLISDIKMPKLNGVDLLQGAKAADPQLPVILMTAYPELDTALAALRAGALDYLLKPFHPEDLVSKVRRALEEKRLREENRLLARHVSKEYAPIEIVAGCPAMGKVLELVDKVAATPADVLILGESGTGKELIARRLHAGSGRRGHFIPVDCGAIPENLLENELFGHEKGAYTDASKAAQGLMELADGGTFFLDEVCELPLALQAKLLRALQERRIRRVGGVELRPVDLRVVAATNRDIAGEVKAGRFREDLFYRLDVIEVRLPALRERAKDIPLLARYYLPKIAREMGRSASTLDVAAMDILAGYRWPGNVRELQNVLKKAVVACESDTIGATDLPECLVTEPEPGRAVAEGFLSSRTRFERELLESLLREHGGNAKAAAEAARLPLSNLYWYLKKHGLDPQSFR
ncbi:MAG: sigma-54-dependent Fis family transcriptional regulator [Elusimicrobia bacterium]|nr:sigma-54-dependent Fis family transcriptional regulator [Elusimicrobiota bacterium]